MEAITNKKEPLILVVDDDTATRVICRAALENDGYQVIEAEGGSSALNIFERARCFQLWSHNKDLMKFSNRLGAPVAYLP